MIEDHESLKGQRHQGIEADMRRFGPDHASSKQDLASSKQDFAPTSQDFARLRKAKTG